jgi:hypothetical protein
MKDKIAESATIPMITDTVNLIGKPRTAVSFSKKELARVSRYQEDFIDHWIKLTI